MAASRFRRFSRGRKFLYESEVEKLLDEDKNSRKKLITSLPIAEVFKSKLSKDENLSEVLTKLEGFGSGVCQISVSLPNSKDSHTGTGFYVGDGWVLTTAHVIRNREQVSNSKLTFCSPQGNAVFETRDRRALVHRMLPPGRRPDYRNRDVTLIKLGVQYTGLRKKHETNPWEKEEQDLLGRYKPFDFKNLIKATFVDQPSAGDVLCAVYDGESQGGRRFQLDFDVHGAYRVLNLRILQFSGSFDATVSGCPILQLKNGQWSLLGVFFAGSYFNAGGGAYAYSGEVLLWSEEITEHVMAGTKAMDQMAAIVSYSVQVPFQERAKLLTIKSVYQAAELALDHRVLIL